MVSHFENIGCGDDMFDIRDLTETDKDKLTKKDLKKEDISSDDPLLLALDLKNKDQINKDPKFEIPRSQASPIAGGVFGLTPAGEGPFHKQGVSVAWPEYRTANDHNFNCGYAGPDLFDWDMTAFFSGIQSEVIWDAGTSWIIHAAHADPRVEEHWIQNDTYTRRTLLDLLVIIFRTSLVGDENIQSAQVICRDVVQSLDFPEEFWHTLLTRCARDQVPLSTLGEHVLSYTLLHPKTVHNPFEPRTHAEDVV